MKGYSLVEVILALFLLMLGELMFYRQQVLMKSALDCLFFKHLAVQECLSLIDLLSLCTDAHQRNRILRRWRASVALHLPQGEAVLIYCSGRHRV